MGGEGICPCRLTNWLCLQLEVVSTQCTIYGAYVHVTITLPLTGKDDALDRDGKGLAHAVVLKLLEGTEGTEHHVYMDNWYNSPALVEDLHRRDYDYGNSSNRQAWHATCNEGHYQEE